MILNLVKLGSAVAFIKYECAKFREWRAIVGLVGLMLSCHLAFAGPKFSLVCILWIFRGRRRHD